MSQVYARLFKFAGGGVTKAHWCQAAFWLVALTVGILSLLPGPYLPPVAFDVWDKAQHAGAFVALGLLGCRAYPHRPVRLLLALLAYGAVIEVVQSISGWRYGDWQDWLADALGVALAALLWHLWQAQGRH